MERSNGADPESNKTQGHEKLLGRIFSQLPKDIGIVNGSKKSLPRYLALNPDLVPERVYPDTGKAISALMAPKSEWPVVRAFRKVPLGDPRDQKSQTIRDTRVQPRVYGIRSLFPLVANLLRPNHIAGEHQEVDINLGIGADRPADRDLPLHLNLSPALPGYVLLGLERLKELREITSRVRLRIFSTGSLIAVLNQLDPEEVFQTQVLQKEMIDAFIEEFYPELRAYVSTDEITAEIPTVGRREYIAARNKILPRLQPAILKSLEQSARKYNTTHKPRIEDAIRYAVYHSLPSTFHDGAIGDNFGKFQVTVGGYSEDPFVAVRGFNESDDPQYRLGVVVRGVLAKTPPYLNRPQLTTNRDGKSVKISEITMQEFLDPNNERVEQLIEDPHSDRSAFSKDIAHIGRCIGGVTREREGIESLRGFYQRLYQDR